MTLVQNCLSADMTQPTEKLVLLQSKENPIRLWWEVVFVNFIEDAVQWLIDESDFDMLKSEVVAVSLIEATGAEFVGGIEP